MENQFVIFMICFILNTNHIYIIYNFTIKFKQMLHATLDRLQNFFTPWTWTKTWDLGIRRSSIYHLDMFQSTLEPENSLEVCFFGPKIGKGRRHYPSCQNFINNWPKTHTSGQFSGSCVDWNMPKWYIDVLLITWSQDLVLVQGVQKIL